MNTLYLTDGYKLDHRRQYPKQTTLVYSNWTPRKSRIKGIDKVVFFGLQYCIQRYLIEDFNKNFFNQPKSTVLARYKGIINHYLGDNKVGTKHIEALHNLGYLPIVIKALDEGTQVPIKVPMFTMYNTKPEFFWLTNYLETLLSTTIWLPCTTATIAFAYKQLLTKYAKETTEDWSFLKWQAHDFSMRGMGGVEASILGSAGHLLSFYGSDTLPTIPFFDQYYQAKPKEEIISGTVPATEHSVMCMGTNKNELQTIKRLITEVYPTGIVSIVSDTWNLWKVLTDYLPLLKQDILNRDGKLVIRPDSGNPVHIICGNPNAESIVEQKGVIELLWETFGGHINKKGYKVLHSNIGAIYGDSITLERAEQICKQLKEKGFASNNIVLGIGSYSYQYNTRDTFGFAMKATYGEVKNKGREIYKDPITDNGTKTSAKGLLKVIKTNNSYKLIDQVNWAEEKQGELKEVFRDGKLIRPTSLKAIRKQLG